MIQLSPELRAALDATANQPVDLYELELAGQTHYFSDQAISWGGHDYLPYVLSRSAIRRYDGGQFDQVQVTLSNVDTSIAQLLLAADIEGRRLLIRKVDRRVGNDSLVLFTGVMEQLSDIDEESATVTAVQLLGSLDHEVPSRRFTMFCPWRFKGFECGYAGAESECDKSWARCSGLGNTNRFGGFRFVPHSGTFQYQEVEMKRFLLLFARRRTVTRTAVFNAVDDTPYDVPIPLALGRVQIAGIPIQYADEGGETKILAALAVGTCAGITYIRANGRLAASADGHLGQLGGTASQLVDPRFPQGYPYNLLCYVGVTVPSDVRSEDPAPVIDCVLLGAIADFYNSAGQWTGFGWTDNPVWLTLWFLRLSLAQGGMGFPDSWIDFGVCAEAAAYCDELIPNTTNDQKIFAPPSLPAPMQVGADYQRFRSTGVEGQDPMSDGPYDAYVPGFDDDTSVTPAVVMVKRFTMNGVIGRAEKAVDVLFKKLLPAFRGYITFSKDGRLQIRAERPVTNAMLTAPAGAGAAHLSVDGGAGFAPGDLVLIGALTASAEVRRVSQAGPGLLELAAPLSDSHAAGGRVHLIHMAFDSSTTIGKITYPLADRQPSTNRVTVKYVDAPAGFEAREVWVNDYEHQAQVRRVNNEDVDGSMIDSYFQAWRIGQWARAKARDLGRFVSIRSNISASALEIGDIITVSSAEHGLLNVPFRVIETGFEPDDEVTITGQLYALDIYDDSAPQATVGVPGVFRPALPGQQPAIGAVTALQAAATISEEGRVLVHLQGTAPVDPAFAGCYAFLEIPQEADPDPVSPAYPGQLFPQGWHFGEPSEAGMPRTWEARLDVPAPPLLYLAQLPDARVTWTLYALSRGWGHANQFVRHTGPAEPAGRTPSVRLTLDFGSYLAGMAPSHDLGAIALAGSPVVIGDARLQIGQDYFPPYMGPPGALTTGDFEGVEVAVEYPDGSVLDRGRHPYMGNAADPAANLGTVRFELPRPDALPATLHVHYLSYAPTRKHAFRKIIRDPGGWAPGGVYPVAELVLTAEGIVPGAPQDFTVTFDGYHSDAAGVRKAKLDAAWTNRPGDQIIYGLWMHEGASAPTDPAQWVGTDINVASGPVTFWLDPPEQPTRVWFCLVYQTPERAYLPADFGALLPVDYVDLPLADGLDLSKADPATLGPGLGIGPDGRLQVPPGAIVAGMIGAINAEQIIGQVTAAQIQSINAEQIAGQVAAHQIAAVTAGQITGQITAGQIASIAAGQITGMVQAGQIQSLGAAQITGVIVTQQLADGILSDIRKFAADLRPHAIVTALPALPSANFPVGATVSFQGKVWRNVANVWTATAEASDISGQLGAAQIAAVNASSIVGLITAAQIQNIAAGQISGLIQSGQIQNIHATQIAGQITAAQIASVEAARITGQIASHQIAGVGAGQIVGHIQATQIASVAANTITGNIVAGGGVTIHGSVISASGPGDGFPGIWVGGGGITIGHGGGLFVDAGNISAHAGQITGAGIHIWGSSVSLGAPSAWRAAMGLGDAATRNVGAAAGQVADGAHTHAQYALISTTDHLQQQINTLAQRVTVLESDLAALQTVVGDLNNRVTALEARG